MNLKLNLGCGHRPKKGFTNVDLIEPSEIPEEFAYVQADIRKLPFRDNKASLVEMYTVIEHLPFDDVIPALKEIYRVMKKGAKLIIVTDDFDGIAMEWLRMRMMPFDLQRYTEVMQTVYGSQRWTGDEHRSCMTTDYLNYCLVQAGFKQGGLTRYYKGTPIPKIGSEPAKPDMGFRTDILVAEVKK